MKKKLLPFAFLLSSSVQFCTIVFIHILAFFSVMPTPFLFHPPQIQMNKQNALFLAILATFSLSCSAQIVDDRTEYHGELLSLKDDTISNPRQWPLHDLECIAHNSVFCRWAH